MSEQELSLEEIEEFDSDSDEYVSPLASGTIEDIEEDFDIEDEISEENDEDAFISDFADEDLVFDADNEPLEDFSDLDVSADVSTDLVVTFDEGNELVEAPELSAEEALELTEHIRSTTDVLYVLVARAHAGKAHLALGYSTFADYVKEEFNISRSRAYQFLNQASVITAIEEATPEGTHFRLSEAAARDLKNYVEELAPEIKERTEGLSPNEAGKVVEEIVSDYRDQLRSAKEAEDDLSDDDFDFNIDELDDIEYDAPDFGGEGGSGGGGSEFDDMENFDSLDEFSGGAKSDSGISLDDPSVFREKLENVYAFYTALTSLEKMPDAQEIIDSIQEARRPHINASLPKAKAWLDSIHAAWFAQEGNLESDSSHVDKELADEDSKTANFDLDD